MIVDVTSIRRVLLAALAVPLFSSGASVVVDDDGNGGAANTSSGATSSSGSTASSASAGGGALTCDLPEALPPDCQSCIDQGFQERCSGLVEACWDAHECTSYSECLLDCEEDETCCEACSGGVRASAVSAWNELIRCYYCSGCQQECAELAGSCQDR